MAIWDRLISAATDLHRRIIRNATDETAKRKITFTIGVIALSAKMAKADGQVTSEEIAAFQKICDVADPEIKNVTRIYNMAKRDTAGYEVYAKQIGALFDSGSPVLEELVDALFFIAKADGHVHPAELAFLRNVADNFGFSKNAFEQIAARHLKTNPDDPYAVLGIAPETPVDTLKSHHRKLIKEHHPDRLISQGLPEAFISVANDRLAAINAAYDQILADRGIG